MASGRDDKGKEELKVETLQDNNGSRSRKTAEAEDHSNEKKRKLRCDSDGKSEEKGKVDYRVHEREPCQPSNFGGDAMAAEGVVSEIECLCMHRKEVLLRFIRVAKTTIPEDTLLAPTPLPKIGLTILLLECSLMRTRQGRGRLGQQRRW